MNEDAMISATAIVHSMTLVTRNVTDYSQFGVKLFNPFSK
jgi:toxin FitB